MKKVYTLLILLLTLQTNIAQAGLHSFTIHSRANCGNNESISWWAGHALTLLTVSDHFLGGGVHELNTGWVHTWRSAAVHWGEARPGSGWRVIGTHWGINPANNQATFLGNTSVTDCSIYDGWWD